MTEFAKIWNNAARTEIQIIIMDWHESHTFAPSRQTNERATNHQVCFFWNNFCDALNLWQFTMECTVPLGCTNNFALGVKLLPATVLAWQVNCGCLCTSMDKSMTAFLFKRMKEPAFSSPPTPNTHPTPSHPPTHPPTHPLTPNP